MVQFITWLIKQATQLHKKYTLSFWIYTLCLIAMIISLLVTLQDNSQNEPEQKLQLSYSEFWSEIKNNNIKEVTIYFISRQIFGIISKQGGKQEFQLQAPSVLVDSIQIALNKIAKVQNEPKIIFKDYTPPPENNYKTIFKFFVWSPLIVIAIWTLIIISLESEKKAKMPVSTDAGTEINSKTKVTFADIGGLDEVIQEIETVVEFLKNPEKVNKLGGKMPKGYLLVGPPGTGKTLIAKAIASESGRPFFAESGSGIVEIFVGVGPKRIKTLFQKARENKPAVIFIDDIDSVGRARTITVSASGSEEYDNTLIQLLTEMDGVDTKEGIIVFGATNIPERLDRALVRPGRFDKQILVGLPDLRGREAILKIHTRNVKIKPELDLHKIAQSLPGFAGADIANLVNQAAIKAFKKNKDFVDEQDFSEAKDGILQGEKRNILITPEDKMKIAYHESGHTIATILTPHAGKIEKVSVIPRGLSLGATYQTPEEKLFSTKEQIEAQLIVLMAGREGEKIITNTISTGSKDDMEKATRLATKMVCEWGMNENIGPVIYSQNSKFLEGTSTDINSSERMRYQIDQEIKNTIVLAQQKAQKLIYEHRQKLAMLASKLVEKETLEQKEIYELLNLNIETT